MMSEADDVSLADIETALSRLWEHEEGEGKTRACLFNLIIYTQERARADYFRETIRMVIEKLPCRVLFVQVDPDAKNSYLRTGVSTESGGEGSSAIVCEVITIEASGDQMARVPFLLLPHIVPDMPVYLLWGQDPCSDSEILPKLQNFARRVIFDSDSSEDLNSLATNLLDRIGGANNEIVDMNWARLTGWRRVVAQAFDCSERIEQLRRSSRVEITYNGNKGEICRHSSLQARYFQAWLAGRMGWTFVDAHRDDSGIHLNYVNVDVVLRPEKFDKLAAGSLVKIDFTTPNNHIILTRNPGERQVRVEISSADTCEIPVTLPLSIQERGMQFITQLFYEPPSSQYRAMLAAMAQQTQSCP